MSDALRKTRRQEVELPARLNVVYLNLGTDYQQGVQSARRMTGSSGETVNVEAPIALSDAKAKAVADLILYNAWTERTQFSFTTTRKYAWLEPTDVIAVGGYTVRLTGKEELADGSIRWTAVAENAALYAQAAASAPAQSTAQSIALAGPTNLQLLDIALLRDVDDAPGFYAAAAGYLAGWNGAVLYKSSDGGASYAPVSSFTTGASLGTAKSALGNFLGGNTWDETNTVTVQLSSGSLASATATDVLNGANAALLGSEIIQFRVATLNADGTYTLSGLLRGRKGSEWAMGSHASGERFVLLSAASLQRITVNSAEIGRTRHYKGVSIGATLAEASAQAFTLGAVALEPLSAVHLGGGRNAAGDVTLKWVRRTRTGGEWRDYVDAALGEASESYEVEIWDAGYTTLKRTIAGLTTPTTTYTSAQQVTDFGANQATVYFKVFQLSSTVGRGYEARGTA